MAGHLASWRESKLLSLCTRACLNFISFTFRTLGKCRNSVVCALKRVCACAWVAACMCVISVRAWTSLSFSGTMYWQAPSLVPLEHHMGNFCVVVLSRRFSP